MTYPMLLTISVIGKIPFNQAIIESIVNGQSIMETSGNTRIKKTLENIWDKLNHALHTN